MMLPLAIVLALLLEISQGFSPYPPHTVRQLTKLHAKQKGRGNARGFGKKLDASEVVETPKGNGGSTATNQQMVGLSSIDDRSSQSSMKPRFDIDPNLPIDQRNKEILKQKYGLRSYEERQGDVQAALKASENQKRLQQIKKMKDEDFDIFMVLPPSLIRGIDAFLKVGLGLTTVLFVLAGLGITAEAWAVSTGNTLPENVDQFIVNIIEPNFTTGLLVLLGFSISLGIFAAAQLGSGSSMYKEQP